ncbi:MAG: zf-TFIIB domain-containing protein [Candidatus Eremiobacteraeota bacterium]|nr:zf-TFIIB domain-containing protein [Candidatus Eremiobacteraeota bacterium]
MPLRCPACNIAMSPAKDPHSGLEIDNCTACYGIWFDADELREFFSSAKLSKQFMLPAYRFEGQNTVDITMRARRCPRCSKTRLTRLDVGGIAVDECESCRGIWLDAGEVARLVQQYNLDGLKGGHETAKQIRAGMHDQTSLGKASRFITEKLRTLFGKRQEPVIEEPGDEAQDESDEPADAKSELQALVEQVSSEHL